MIGEPECAVRTEGADDLPTLVWRCRQPVMAISTAVHGGGIGPCAWLINATVPMSYGRMDPQVHLREVAENFGLAGPGVGLLTGVDVGDVVRVADEEVRLWATVGLGAPVQAADPSALVPATDAPVAAGTPVVEPPGTINIVAWVPQRLSPGALVNAVATVTEAKVQAVRELNLAATGTASDAVVVLCPAEGIEAPFGGPRSAWGGRLARAGYRAVLDGGRVNLAGRGSWSAAR